ncbi:MAG: hypothetical protein IKE69_11595 [Thermoguttaceae bacterium]|nr:hypothetical protein [Thermoguttaceae bacterium]
MRKVKFTNEYNLDIVLTDKDAVKLFQYLVNATGHLRVEEEVGKPEFFYEDTGKPMKVGTAYVSETFSTTDFWDESNGREIADRYGIKDIGKRYYFTEEEYNQLKAELEANPYWKKLDESDGCCGDNIYIDLLTANEWI